MQPTDGESAFGRLHRELREFREFAATEVWRGRLKPKLEACLAEHERELSAPGNADRAERVWAYRMAKELCGWLDAEIASRKAQLDRIVDSGGGGFADDADSE